MANLPRALPRSFRDLHFCFRESKFRTAASASFRGVDCFYDFSRSASAVTRGASAKAFCRGCMEMCCLYLLVSKALWDNVFGCTGWRVWSTYQSNTFRFWISQMANTCDISWWVNHFAWSYLPYKWAGGLSVPPLEKFASAKLPRSFRKEHEHFYQNHTKIIANGVYHSSTRQKTSSTNFGESTSGTITKAIAIHLLHGFKRKCKRQHDKLLQKALPRSFHIKKRENCFRELPRLQSGANFWFICPNPA